MAEISREAPVKDQVVDSSFILTRAWFSFFTIVTDALFYLGSEKSFNIDNNKTTATAIDGLVFDKRFVSSGYVDYLIQRTTNTNESVEAGTFFVSYKPKSDTWQIVSGPTTSGVTLTINSRGQVLYTTTNQSGTKAFSRFVYRARAIKAKDSSYSQIGNGGAR